MQLLWNWNNNCKVQQIMVVKLHSLKSSFYANTEEKTKISGRPFSNDESLNPEFTVKYESLAEM